MMTLSQTVATIKDLFNSKKTVAQTLPALLLHCITLKRSGGSALNTTSNIIRACGENGIYPTGVNADGTQNKINAYTYLVVREVFKEIKMNGVIDTACCEGTIQFQGDGANSGGPVHIVGTNTNCFKMKGIFI